jgi:hypothetical protein
MLRNILKRYQLLYCGPDHELQPCDMMHTTMELNYDHYRGQGSSGVINPTVKQKSARIAPARGLTH